MTAVLTEQAVRSRIRHSDLIATGCYLALAFVVFARLWADPNRRYLSDSGQDQQQWEWFFAVTARNLVHLDNPLFTDLLNHPTGVNLMANTVMFGLCVPLAPLTLALGPGVTWAVIMTGGLAATGVTWYWLLSRHLVRSRTAAAVGAGLAAFSPPVISHANAHPNFVVLWVIPLIVHRLLNLRGRRDGVLLGLLVSFQVYIGEEALLLAALGLAVFLTAYALQRPGFALTLVRRSCRPLLIGFAVTLALTGFPLGWQFFGPQSYDSLVHGPAGNPLEAFWAFSGTGSPTERNAHFGWPLLLVSAVAAVRLRRSPVAVAVSATAAVCAVLSLGPQVVAFGHETGLPTPWLLLARLPLLESVIESRLGLVVGAALGVLLALVLDHTPCRSLDANGKAKTVSAHRRAHLAFPFASNERHFGLTVVVAALVPILPVPLPAHDRAEVPALFSTGEWREYVRPGRSVVPVPPPSGADSSALQWQIEAGLEFAVPEGYFVGPWGDTRIGAYGPYPRPTTELLRQVHEGAEVTITAQHREQARTDLAHWRADAVVLLPQRGWDRMRATLDELLGPGRYAGGVWLWEIGR